MTPAFRAVQKLLTLHQKLELERDTLLLGRQAQEPGSVGLPGRVTDAALYRKARTLKSSILALKLEIEDLKRPNADLEKDVLAIAKELGVEDETLIE